MSGAGEPVRVRTRHIADYRQDPQNLRQHNPRNIGMIVDAMHHVGAGRSLVADETDTILAGNGAAEAAAEAGITRVIEVEADGNELVVVKRAGLTEAQKRALAVYDNRAGELSTWDVAALKAAFEADREGPADGPRLSGLWREPELAKLLASAPKDPEAPGAFAALDETLATEHKCPKCGYEWSGGGG